MNSERAQAYGRVMRHLEELGGAKLQPTEQHRIREAADTLLFSEDPTRDEVVDAQEDAEALIEGLQESDRLTEERSRRLLDDLAACGPLARV
jgi:hypothetical protein